MKRLLLHTCCGPCFLGTWENLSKQNFEVTSFFYNPNIHPIGEYSMRLDSLKTASLGKIAEIITPAYEPQEYCSKIKVMTTFPERCKNCYFLRLERTVQAAKEMGFDAFTTTLLISPYQQHELLIKLSRELEKKYEIEFYYSDFRSSFRLGQNEARAMAIYRQKYCGCSYSRLESEK